MQRWQVVSCFQWRSAGHELSTSKPREIIYNLNNCFLEEKENKLPIKALFKAVTRTAREEEQKKEGREGLRVEYC